MVLVVVGLVMEVELLLEGPKLPELNRCTPRTLRKVEEDQEEDSRLHLIPTCVS